MKNPPATPQPGDFDDFLRQACPSLDLQWRKYRRRAARHRVLRRMAELGLPCYGEYLARLREPGPERDRLASLMRVTVSRFFRERPCWIDLAERHLPSALAPSPPGEAFRAWSVGCCGGEEPYTLAIVWREWILPRFPGRGLKVVATDIDDDSLARAQRRIYAASSIREVPDDIRRRWFERRGEAWILDERAAAPGRFVRADFMEADPPGRFDLVLCRYLPFTYYRGERRLSAARRLAAALVPGGLLFIGRKEGLGPRERELFEPLSQASGVYRVRKRSSERR